MKLIIKYLRPLFGTMAFGLSVKVLATLCELGLPYILSYIMDELVPLQQVMPIVWGGVAMITAALLELFDDPAAGCQNLTVFACDRAQSLCFDGAEMLFSAFCEYIRRY